MDIETGKVAVITGAANGIGLELANSFAQKGCSIVLADVQEDALATAEEQISAHGVDTIAVRTDVSQADELEALAATTLERFGAVHVVCNNAGVAGKGDPWTGPIETWEWTMGVNFWGVVHGVRAFLPHLVMSGGGHIVNTASIAGLLPGFSPAYDASKHAVVAISEGLFRAMEVAQMPIGVSCLCPGWVRTGIVDADRNWPEELGPKPAADVGAQIGLDYVRRAIDEGLPPAVVADQVVDAIAEGRFWVFPHAEFLDLAVQRFHSIAEGLNPTGDQQAPGMPPTSQIVEETIAAMLKEPEA